MKAQQSARAVIFLGFFLLVGQAAAGSLSLDGPLIQGGLVIGKTDPGAKVSIDGRSVRVSSEGAFLMGFGRNAKKAVRLRLDHPDGTRTEKTLNVKDREYQVQRIDGLPARQVTPLKPEDLARIRDDNTKIAVARILGHGRRQRTSAFSELQSHYLFEDRFGRPAKGNDKGKVEGLVGYARRNFFAPIPSFENFDALNTTLRSNASFGVVNDCVGTQRPSDSAWSET